MTTPNRYAKDWNEYSKEWEASYGSKHHHLGDEWNNAEGFWNRDDFYFTIYAERWLRPDSTVLEIGPGGGKWTVRIAPKVKRVIALDVSEEMLERTRQRCESLGLSNVDFMLGNGRDFQPVADESVHFFFSYDVFVHIALEDTWPYSQEMARVLAPDGVGVCHYAINSMPQSWDRVEQHNDWYRFGQHTLGQFYYYSPLALQRMYEHCGLSLLEQHQERTYCTCVFSKPAMSLAPRLELLLRRLISDEANDGQARAALVAELQALPRDLEQRLGQILAQAEAEGDYYQRVKYAAIIRRLWRGI